MMAERLLVPVTPLCCPWCGGTHMRRGDRNWWQCVRCGWFYPEADASDYCGIVRVTGTDLETRLERIAATSLVLQQMADSDPTPYVMAGLVFFSVLFTALIVAIHFLLVGGAFG